MARPRKETMTGIKVRIPSSLHAKVALLLLNPVYGRVRYGDWTNLMTSLLTRWLDEQITQRKENSGGTDVQPSGQ